MSSMICKESSGRARMERERDPMRCEERDRDQTRRTVSTATRPSCAMPWLMPIVSKKRQQHVDRVRQTAQHTLMSRRQQPFPPLDVRLPPNTLPMRPRLRAFHKPISSLIIPILHNHMILPTMLLLTRAHKPRPAIRQRAILPPRPEMVSARKTLPARPPHRKILLTSEVLFVARGQTVAEVGGVDCAVV